MKLFNAIAAITVIGASFVAASPAQARNGWIYADSSSKGVDHYIKARVCNGSFCFADEKNSAVSGVFTVQYNCSGWYKRIVGFNGQRVQRNWSPIMPLSIGETKAKIACR